MSFQWKFSKTWDKKINGKTWYSALSSIIFFRHQKFSGTPNCSYWVFFQFCETKKRCSTKKLIPPANPKNISMPENFSETMKSSQWNFLLISEKKNRWRNVISPSLIHVKFSLPELFWNTEKLPVHFLGKSRHKNFWRNFVAPPLLFIYFFPQTTKSLKPQNFPMNFSDTVIQKFFDGKTLYSFLSSIQTFRCQKYFETPKKCQKKFAVMWDKKISTEKRGITPWHP